MKNRKKKIIKWSLIVAMLLLGYYVILPDVWTRAFWINYYSKPIYIPATKETLYLIKYQSRGDRETIWAEVSTCDWRCFFSEEKEYWYHFPFNDNSFMYYKISNDSLFLLCSEAIIPPPKFGAKVKIMQIEFSNIDVPDCPLIYIPEEQAKVDSVLKTMGYERFQ